MEMVSGEGVAVMAYERPVEVRIHSGKGRLLLGKAQHARGLMGMCVLQRVGASQGRSGGPAASALGGAEERESMAV